MVQSFQQRGDRFLDVVPIGNFGPWHPDARVTRYHDGHASSFIITRANKHSQYFIK